MYEKKDIAKRFKILLDTDLKIILLAYQNNFVGTLKIMINAAKNFDFSNFSFSVLHSNYFNSLRKLLFFLYSKILDLSAKPFFPFIIFSFSFAFFFFI